LQSTPRLGKDGFIRSKSYAGVLTIKDGARPASVGGSFNIALNRSASLIANTAASAAFDRAVAYVESLFDDPVTIYIDADVSNLGNTSVIGSTNTVNYSLSGGYADFRASLAADNRASEAIVDQLPTSTSNWVSDTGFTVSFPVANGGNLAALGQTPSLITGPNGNASAYVQGQRRDATIRFNSSFNFDFDPTNGTTTNQVDFFSVAVHEIFHAMGFESGIDDLNTAKSLGITQGTVSPTPLDFFRLKPVSERRSQTFTNAPRLITTGSNYSRPVLIDGVFDPTGITGVFNAPLSIGEIPVSTGDAFGDGNQASHWKDDVFIGRKIGIMDPNTSGSIVESTRAVDVRMLGLIGWDVASAGSAVLGDDGVLNINGTSGSNVISGAISSNTTGGQTFTASIRANSVTVPGYFNNADISGFIYKGNGGNDTISGTTRNETLYGDAGNDSIDAAGGNDSVFGGSGDDPQVTGGNGNDRVYGDDGNDVIGGGAGNDLLYGGGGNDLIEASSGNDSLDGENGVDRLFGNDDDDRLYARDNILDEFISGGPGDDTAEIDNGTFNGIAESSVVISANATAG
jgi:Ca2+-binding RTX toxin-like protein